MATVTGNCAHVVGIDTHARTHRYCTIESRTNGIVDNRSFPTTCSRRGCAIS